MSFFEDASLVLIPSGIKNQKIYSVKPTDGTGDLTFTRASNATRVASNGLIEKVRTNLITYSEDMVTAKAVSSVTATNNVTTAPDGTTTSASVEANGVSTVFIRTSANFGAVNFSLYLKYDSQQFVQIIQSADAACFVNFDIQNGVIGNAGAKTTNVQIENVGSGWYRCSAYLNASGAGTLRVYHVSSLSAGFGGSSTTIGNTYFTWGWQAEDGDIATDYIATTSAAVSVGPVSGLPRLDYLNSSCPRLLLEGQRTSNALFSEQLDNAFWSKSNVTLTSTLGGPIDQSKYFTITCNATTGVFKGCVVSWINLGANTYTLSVFAKAGSTSTFVVASRSNLSGTSHYATFNLSTGAVVNSFNGSGTITPYGDGWYRCAFTVTSGGGYNDAASFFFGHPQGAANGATVLATGAMSEIGAYPSSYIPTLSTSVTRVADAASKQNIAGTLPTAYPFTLFGEGYLRENGEVLVSINDISAFDVFYQIGATSSGFYASARNATTSAILASGRTEGVSKVAAVFTSTTIKLFANGALLASGANAQTFNTSANDLLLGQLRVVSDSGVRSPINQALVFNSALTDAQCIELTTL